MQIMDSHLQAALEMPPKVGQRFLKALKAYVQDGEQPDFSAPEDWPLRSVWTAIAPVLETSKDISAKRSQAGRRGAEARERRRAEAGPDEAAGELRANACKEAVGASSGKSNSSTVEASASKRYANASNGGASASGREEEEEREVEKKGQGRGRAQARFSPPTPEEVGAYASEAGISIDPGAFVDHYASKGWKVGSQPMRDWRAAVRNWARRDRERCRDGSKVVRFSGRQGMSEVSEDVLSAYL